MSRSLDQKPFQFGLGELFAITVAAAIWSAVWRWLPWDAHLVAAAPALIVLGAAERENEQEKGRGHIEPRLV